MTLTSLRYRQGRGFRPDHYVLTSNWSQRDTGLKAAPIAVSNTLPASEGPATRKISWSMRWHQATIRRGVTRPCHEGRVGFGFDLRKVRRYSLGLRSIDDCSSVQKGPCFTGVPDRGRRFGSLLLASCSVLHVVLSGVSGTQ